jgi:hypothetical protein
LHIESSVQFTDERYVIICNLTLQANIMYNIYML